MTSSSARRTTTTTSSLAPSASCAVNVQYVVQASDLGTTILNTATGDTDQTDPNTDTETVPVPTPCKAARPPLTSRT